MRQNNAVLGKRVLSLEEFLEHLNRVSLNFLLKFEGGLIAKSPAGSLNLDPVCAVCFHLTGDLYNYDHGNGYKLAAKQIGLRLFNAKRIFLASLSPEYWLPVQLQPLRKKLLEAVKLDEKTYVCRFTSPIKILGVPAL